LRPILGPPADNYGNISSRLESYNGDPGRPNELRCTVHGVMLGDRSFQREREFDANGQIKRFEVA
jgi:hypothetical protein